MRIPTSLEAHPVCCTNMLPLGLVMMGMDPAKPANMLPMVFPTIPPWTARKSTARLPGSETRRATKDSEFVWTTVNADMNRKAGARVQKAAPN